MSNHAPLSPSSRYRWQLCPGSIRALGQYEDDENAKSSASAIDGTHSHTLLEYCVKNVEDGKARDPKHYVGMILRDHEGVFSPDMERAARVRVAVEYINSRVAELPNATMHAEKPVDPAPLLGRHDMYGTVDVHIFSDHTLEIIDYKDGMNEVIAKDNPQLEQYFFGIIGEYAKAGKLLPVTQVRLTVIQPKVATKGMNPISYHDYPIGELLSRTEKIIAEAAATDAPDAPFVPGDKQCRYCQHKVNCSAFRDMSFGAMGVKFESILPDVQETSGDKLPDEKLRELVEAAPLIRKMLEEAEGEALRRIQSGHPIVGLKVVRGSGRRGWAFTDEEMEAKLKRFKLPKSVIWQQSLISPAQAEKVRWAGRDGEEHQLTEKQIELLNKEFVKRSEGKMTVVPEADRRAAMDFGDLSKMFGEVTPAAPAAPEADPLPAWLS